MSFETTVKCNSCWKEIGDKKHFSFSFSNKSGIAIPPGEGIGSWRVVMLLQGEFIHFCGMKCLSSYFSKLIKEAK